jgi:hypothetical protein
VAHVMRHLQQQRAQRSGTQAGLRHARQRTR